MIKISKSKSELNLLAKAHLNTLELAPFEISKRLDAALKVISIKAYEKIFFSVLKNHLSKIILSTPDELVKLDKIISPLYQTYLSKKTYGLKGNFKKSATKKANEIILSIFCYDDFISKSNGKFAYQLTTDLNVDVCLYCNRQFTSTLNTKDGKCRPTLDHFIDKGKQPYFALSFFNLIPSCYVCNSSLKNQKQFSVDKNLHPFIESTLDVLNFTLNIKAADFISGKKTVFDIHLVADKNCKDAILIGKAKANAQIFKIEELYSGHKDYASEIIKKAYYYNKSKIEELYKYKTEHGTSLFKSKEEVLEFALGNYINEQRLGKRVLSKFTRDLAKDLGMTKHI